MPIEDLIREGLSLAGDEPKFRNWASKNGIPEALFSREIPDPDAGRPRVLVYCLERLAFMAIEKAKKARGEDWIFGAVHVRNFIMVQRRAMPFEPSLVQTQLWLSEMPEPTTWVVIGIVALALAKEVGA